MLGGGHIFPVVMEITGVKGLMVRWNSNALIDYS